MYLLLACECFFLLYLFLSLDRHSRSFFSIAQCDQEKRSRITINNHHFMRLSTMLEHIEFMLFKIAILTGSALYSFTDTWGWLLSFIAGIGLPTLYFDKPKKPFDEIYDWGLKATLSISTVLVLIYFIYPSILVDTINLIKIK